MKYVFCYLAGFRVGFLKLFNIAPEFSSGASLYLVSKILGIFCLHNSSIQLSYSEYLKESGCQK